MNNVRKDQELMRYFPNSFLKRDPPGSYFWPVVSVILREGFTQQYENQLEKLKKTIKRPIVFEVTPEHLKHLQAKKEENMSLCLAMKKTGVEKNISYLRKSSQPADGERRGPIDRYFPP